MRLPLTILLLALAALRAFAQPAITPDTSVMALDDLGLYAVGYAYRGQPEQQFPLGWSGFFEDKTGVACEPFGSQNGKRVFLLHCPWRNGTGIAFQQFNFQLPANSTRILLTGATAMSSTYYTQSDGVTFRVFANGAKLLEWNQTNDVWRPFSLDFTSLAGANLLLRFEVDPGPRNNASYDYSFWGDRTLTIEGYNPPPITHPAPPPLTLSNMWPAQTGTAVPRDGFAGTTSCQLSNQVALFHYSGADGSLDYVWRRPQSTNDPLLGALTLTAQMTGDTPVSIPLANAANFSWTSTATLQSAYFQPANGGVVLLQTFRVGTTNVTVSVGGQLSGKSLVLSLGCNQPFVQTFDAGSWGPVLRRRQLVVPYYPDAVYFFPRENLFTSVVLDWTASAASSLQTPRAYYNALTSGARNPLQERIIYTAAWHPAEVLPNNPNPPSPYLDFLANKVVLDIWGGTFANLANNLTNLADYGITNCVAIIHDWQRSGYDNALPAHIPANASYGGDPGMSNLVATANRLGIPAALHENYVDYYPNYDFYTTNDIALDSQGKLVLAWLNEGTGIQSFAVKPNAILRLAATQSPEIHRRYNTAANYLDVHSAVPPWFHVDCRATEPGAGTFAKVWDVHRQLWAYERATHQGPVFGEGNNHWYWSGCLDGVEAQYGSGWPGNQGLTAPLHVDFDLLKIHPLQFNHGMGYHSRWWPDSYDTNWSGSVPMVVLDQYRLQEVAYGHAGFLGPTWSQIPLAWQDQHLLSPVTARYGSARPVDIRYEEAGAWLDATAAAKLETNRDRVRVTYDNGLVLTANANANTLAVDGWVLPQSGWLARGAGLTAGTVLRQGLYTDFADTGDSLFLNARSAADWNLSSFRRVHPFVAQFQQTASRAFRVTYGWQVGDLLAKDCRCFVHFCQTNTIKFQQDHTLTPPTSQWQVGQTNSDGPYTVTISSSLPDGDYDWLIGLYDSSSGARVPLQGIDAGTSRIRLGTLRIQNSGALVSFLPETNTNYPDLAAMHRVNLNLTGQVIDFGDVRTDGSVWMRWDGKEWILKTWPRDRSFTLEFDSARFGAPTRVQCVGAATNQVVPIANGTRWRLPLNQASEYRWSTNALRLSSLVPASSVWKFNDTGANLGDTWRGTNYDDSAWPSGPAQLGFGDGDEATLIASNRQVTTYFRSSFVFSNTNHLSALTLRLLRDDGAVVYLNGTEVFRSNLPTNTTIYFNTPASTSVPAADETTTFYPLAIDPNLLHPGTNVLAVEVHQASGVMDDLSFDLDLAAETWPYPPQLLARSQPGHLELAWPSWAEGAALWFATNLALPILWQRATNAVITTNDQASVLLTPGSGTRFFRLQGP